MHEERKKVLFVIDELPPGGIQYALIKLVNLLEHLDITVLSLSGNMDTACLFNSSIKVGSVRLQTRLRQKIVHCIKKLRIGKLIKSIGVRLSFAVAQNIYLLWEDTLSYAEAVGPYDFAVAYSGGFKLTTLYTVEKVAAPVKIMWVHEDWASPPERLLACFTPYFQKFRKIYCVSQGALSSFMKHHAELKDKAEVFYNLVDSREFLMRAEGFGCRLTSSGMKILTVGRLSWEKGQDMIPEIVARLVSEGYQFKWFLIGDGDLKKLLLKKIKHYQLSDHLVLLGHQENPYPCFRDCDIYVQTSRSEGYCLAMAEAASFRKPIVTTSFVSASEFVNDNENGLIVPCDPQHIYKALKKLLDHPGIIQQFKKNMKPFINTYSELDKLLDYIAAVDSRG